MKYSITNTIPYIISTPYVEIKDTEHFIKTIKHNKPQTKLIYRGVWSLKYEDETFIVLKDVANKDLHTIRKVLFPKLKYFKITSTAIGTEIEGYFANPRTGYYHIYLVNENGTLEDIDEFNGTEDENLLKKIIWRRRSYLREEVESGNCIIHTKDLLSCGKYNDCEFDIFYALNKCEGFDFEEINGFWKSSGGPIFAVVNGVRFKFENVVEDKSAYKFNDGLFSIFKESVYDFYIEDIDDVCAEAESDCCKSESEDARHCENCSFLRTKEIEGDKMYVCINHMSSSIDGLMKTCMFDLKRHEK